MKIIPSFLLFMACSLFPAAPGWAQACLTGACHQNLVQRTVVHEPAAAGECLACHEQLDPRHGQEAGKSFHLPLSGGDLCYQCHTEELPAAQVHVPVTKGDCLSCHDPHGAEVAKLLKEKKPDLCFTCHPGISSVVRKAPIKHPALYRTQSCGTCHGDHTSSAPALLLREEVELCLTCHGQDSYLRSTPLRNVARELQEKSYLHAPLADGRCSACHAPHGSSHYRLLRESYPTGPYAPYREGLYDFCFQCHNPSMLRKGGTGTGFRNGSRNLHHLHVANPTKGRVCTTCHAAHASSNPRLINESSRFGDWEIPVSFQASSTGGSCAPGCHQPIHYDRSLP